MCSGKTDHFTNFAILLGANVGADCEDDTNYIISWLSLAFIIVAILIIVLAVAIIEYKTRQTIKKREKQMKTGKKKTSQASTRSALLNANSSA